MGGRRTLSVCRFAGLSVCRFVGLSVCRFVGLPVCRFAGLPVCRFAGLLVCWFAGLDQVSPAASLRPVVDVTNIPSVFDAKETSVQKAVCQSAAACGGCGTCTGGGASQCCLPWWAHRTGGFGELLYLSAGNSDLIYATEQTGPNPGASPTGPIGVSNIGEHLGYRFGFSVARSNCRSVVLSYARWDGSTTSVLESAETKVAKPSGVVRPIKNRWQR